MKELYQKLAEAFADKTYRVAKGELLDFHRLSHFVSMKGTYYDEQPCRLLLIGRAVNGWGSFSFQNAEGFGICAEQEFRKNGFFWVVSDQKGLHNVPDPDFDDKTYYLSQSPFWRTSKQIWEQLSGNQQERWVDYIAWSNIYKIAPPKTGNPTTKMCRTQIEICRELLKKEIMFYRPTHILFVTGWKWWFDDKDVGVSSLFEKLNFIGENRCDPSRYVEGTAIYKDAFMAVPVVVACRPERRNEQAYVQQLVTTFQQKKD